MFLFKFLYLFFSTNAKTYTYFDTPTFTDLQGWSISCAKTSGNYVGIHNSLSYAGLGYLNTQYFSDALYKTFYDLPSHHSLRMSAQLYILSQQRYIFHNYIIQIFADDRLVFKYELPNFIVLRIEQLYNFDVMINHCFEYTLIRIQLQTQDTIVLFQQKQITTLGIRDLKISFLECPSECIRCKFGDVQADCLDWKKLAFGLSEKEMWNFINDGWQAQGIQYNDIFSCNSNYVKYRLDAQYLNFFGLFDQDTNISKQFILPPHYQIKIKVLFLIVQNDFRKNPSLIIQIDGNYIYTQETPIDFKSSQLCSFSYLNTDMFPNNDEIFRLTTDPLPHSSLTMYTQLQIQQKSTIIGLWGIRDFLIFYKKCHASCTQSCIGPLATHCTGNQIQYINLHSAFTTTTIIDQGGWDALVSYTQTTVCNNNEILGELQGEYKLQYMIQNFITFSNFTLLTSLYQLSLFNDDQFDIQFNGKQIYSYIMTPLPTKWSIFLCGNINQYDKKIDIQINDLNSSNIPYAIFSFTTNQPQSSQGYWGIRDIAIKFDLAKSSNKYLMSKGKNNNLDEWYYAEKMTQIQECGTKFQFFGYFQQQHTLRKLFTTLPQHQQLHISFRIIVKYTILSQLEQYNISLSGNGNLVWYATFGFNHTFSYCSVSQTKAFQFEQYFNHSQPYILFEFKNSFDNDKQWGIRDIVFEYI